MDNDVLFQLYDAFNTRHIDTVLAAMHATVEWPNAIEGGYITGHDAVREYWLGQFSQIDPHVDPIGFREEDDGRIAVTVHQVVRDLNGKVIADNRVEHVYRIEDGLISHMEIRQPQVSYK